MQRFTLVAITVWLLISFSLINAQDYGVGKGTRGVKPILMNGNSAGIEYSGGNVMYEGQPIDKSHTVIYDSKSNALTISLRDETTMPPDHPFGIGSVGVVGEKKSTNNLQSNLLDGSDFRYTCLMETHNNSWSWWYNFDWAAFSLKITEQSNLGRRFQNIDTYGHDDFFLYASTWNGDGQGWAWELNHQDVSAFIDLLNAWPNGTTRYRPIDFAIHPWLNTTQLYGAVAVADNKGFGWIINSDFAAFDNWITTQWNNGRRIINVDVYHHPGSATPVYAGISEDGDYAQWVWFNMDWAGYVTKFNEHTSNGFRPIDYAESGNTYLSRYAGIWNADEVAANWWINYGNETDFVAGINSSADNGYRPRTLAIFDAEELINSVEPTDVKQIATKFKLNPNYPNPFNPSTTINFSLPSAEYVTLNIYNVIGEKIVTLVSDNLTAGNYDYNWDAKDSSGNPLSSGVYIYQLIAGNKVSLTRKMVLMK